MMIRFAFVDQDGIPTGGGSNRALPAGAVALPSGLGMEDLHRIKLKDGVWTLRPAATPPPLTGAEGAAQAASLLARARSEAVTAINTRIDRFRLSLTTEIAGQAQVYADKAAEARAYVAEADQAGEPATLTDYPMIAAEVGVTAETPWQVAQVWLDRAARTKALRDASEALRQAALTATLTAPDEASLDAIRAELTAVLRTLTP